MYTWWHWNLQCHHVYMLMNVDADMHLLQCMHIMYIHIPGFENQLGGGRNGKINIQSRVTRPVNPPLRSRTRQVQWNRQVLCCELELYHCLWYIQSTDCERHMHVIYPFLIAVMKACKTVKGVQLSLMWDCFCACTFLSPISQDPPRRLARLVQCQSSAVTVCSSVEAS